MKVARWNPFRLRNLALAALVIGVVAGLWLGDVFKGLGGGNSLGIGLRDSESGKSGKFGSRTELASDVKPAGRSDGSMSRVVRILIDGRKYYVREKNETRPIDLKSLVDLVKSTPPNDDGLRAIVDRTKESRASAEHKLSEALKEADIPEQAVYWKQATEK